VRVAFQQCKESEYAAVVGIELIRSYSDSALALKDKRGRAGRMRRDLADVGL